MAATKPRIEFDVLWKNIIERFIEEFVEFFMPDLCPKINFDEAPVFKDKELDKIFGDGKSKDVRRCDKLVQLHLKDGQKCWILVHIEVQKKLNNTLPKRMFRYFYRIFDRYEEQSEGIEAVAILLNKVAKNKYNTYSYKYGKTIIKYNYRTYELFAAGEKELIENKNPFSIVILASRYALKYKDNEKKKASFKYKLARLAFERNYDKQRIVQLLYFIYFVITLADKQTETKLEEEIILKLNTMEPRPLTYQEGLHVFLTKLYGYEFDIDAYISKDLYNDAIREKEQARKKEEQERKEKEQALRNSIVAFEQIGYEPQAIADILKIDVDKVIEIVGSEK